MAHYGSTDAHRRSAAETVQAGAAALGAAAFPLPAIAQSKPFAGITLHGASFQHRFFTLLQNYIPEFEQQTGMKVDLQLSAFPVYNQQANLELSSGGWPTISSTSPSSSRRAGWRPGFSPISTSSPRIRTSRRRTGIPKDFVEGAQVPYRDAKGATYGYSWEGGAMLMGMSRMDLMEKKGLKIPKTFAELQQVCADINGTGQCQRHRLAPTASLVPAALHPGLWRQHLRQSARRHHAGAELGRRPFQAVEFYAQSPEELCAAAAC